MQCVDRGVLDSTGWLSDHVHHMPTDPLDTLLGSAAQRPERRAAWRCASSVRCRIDDGDVQRYARLADVSVSGARVLTALPPPVGKTLRLSFTLADDGQPVRGSAKVVWRTEGFRGRGGVMGIHFMEVSPVDEIDRFIDGNRTNG